MHACDGQPPTAYGGGAANIVHIQSSSMFPFG